MYQICKRCVMDNAGDSYITFDANGYCNYCSDALRKMPSKYFPNEEGKKKLDALCSMLINENRDKKYDCYWYRSSR